MSDKTDEHKKQDKNTDDAMIDIPLGNREMKRSASPRLKKALRRRRIRNSIIALCFILMAFLLYTYRDYLNSDGFLNLFGRSDVLLEAGDLKEQGTIDFVVSDSDQYALYGKGLVAAVSSGYYYLTATGKNNRYVTAALGSPAVVSSENQFAVYSRGDERLIIARPGQILLDKTFSNPIINVTMNAQGGFVVITESDFYKACVYVYSPDCTEIYTWQTSAYYCYNAVLSKDGKHMAASVIAASGQTKLSASICFFNLDTENVKATLPLGESLVSDMYYNASGRLIVIADDRVVTADSKGAKLSEYIFESGTLTGWARGNDFTLLLIDRNRAGSRYLVASVDDNMKLLASFKSNEQFSGLSAAGEHAVLLSGSHLMAYDRALNLKNQVSGSKPINSVLARSDGAIFEIYGSGAIILK